MRTTRRKDTTHRRLILSFALTAILAILMSCNNGKTNPQQDGGDTLSLKYARLLTIVKHTDYTVATVANPWKEGKILQTYILVDRNRKLPKGLPEGTVVRIPLTKSVVFTTVHCSLLMALNKQEVIAGVADLQYIKIPWIQEQCRKGNIADCGEGMSPMVEKIIDLRPDALFLSPFENSGGYGKLEDINIPIIECADYMESSPLGRAEWMKFYGLLVGAETQADSLFSVIDNQYNNLKAKAKATKRRPSVIIDKMVGSVWYVPGGESTVGQLIADASATYPFATEKRSGSISLSFESVLEKSGSADIWLLRYDAEHDMTYRQLAAEHAGYEQLSAYRQRNVYACNVRTTPFYEETPFRPDWLLNDFIRIIHPELTGLAPLRYYKKIEK